MPHPPVNRSRRALISVIIIGYCLALVTYLALQHEVSPLAEIVTKGLFSLSELVVMFYIGGSVVDSTNIAGVMAARMGGQSYQPNYQPYQGEPEPSGGVSLDESGQPEPVIEEPVQEAPRPRQKRIKP